MLNGMFAIGLLDKVWGEANLIGIDWNKATYIGAFKGGEFIFGSPDKRGLRGSLRMISSGRGINWIYDLDIHHIVGFLWWIYKLEPAHILIFDGKSIQKSRYWDIPKEKISISYQEALEETERLIKSSIEYRLLSDLEVGTFLSGGVDSSLVSSIIQESSSSRVQEFHNRFRGWEV